MRVTLLYWDTQVLECTVAGDTAATTTLRCDDGVNMEDVCDIYETPLTSQFKMVIEQPNAEDLQIDRTELLTSSDSNDNIRYRSQNNYCADSAGALVLDGNVMNNDESELCENQGDTTNGLDKYGRMTLSASYSSQIVEFTFSDQVFAYDYDTDIQDIYLTRSDNNIY